MKQRPLKFRCWIIPTQTWEHKMALPLNGKNLIDISNGFWNNDADLDGETYIVSQFTGLHDIVEEKWDEYNLYGYGDPYESDKKREKYSIEFKENSFIFKNRSHCQNSIQNFIRIVIGNIFENPELKYE
jgi:hypothetical protein